MTDQMTELQAQIVVGRVYKYMPFTYALREMVREARQSYRSRYQNWRPDEVLLLKALETMLTNRERSS